MRSRTEQSGEVVVEGRTADVDCRIVDYGNGPVIERWRVGDHRRTPKPERPKPKGLGDTIAKGTKILGIKQCGGCRKRQKKLNEWFPYRDSGKNDE